VAPNPLNPTGVLTFRTTTPGLVSVRIFDLQGRLVRTLAQLPLPAGAHELPIDGKDAQGHRLASGVYFYRIQSAGGSELGRIAILK
jgi:flagellar hook assembly protein FlgD